MLISMTGKEKPGSAVELISTNYFLLICILVWFRSALTIFQKLFGMDIQEAYRVENFWLKIYKHRVDIVENDSNFFLH